MGGVWDGEGFEKGEAGVVFRWTDADAALTAVRGRLLGTTAVLESAESRRFGWKRRRRICWNGAIGEAAAAGAKRTVPGQYFGVMAQ